MRYLIPAVLLLAGCASTPDTMRGNGPDDVIAFSGDPRQSAECTRERINSVPYKETNVVLRNARPTISDSGGTITLMAHQSYGTPYIVDFSDSGEASVYISKGYGWHDTTADAVIASVRDCATG